jgi:hypothetical protein
MRGVTSYLASCEPSQIPKEKQAFREQWKACRIVNLTGTKSQTTTDTKTSGMKGVYQPRSVIIKKASSVLWRFWILEFSNFDVVHAGQS